MTATLPTTATMMAAVYRNFGGPDVVRIERVARPVPRQDEILVRVHASTVSVADHRVRSLDIPPGLRVLATAGIGVFRPRRSVLGMDVAGVVEAVGAKVTRFTVGDEVIALTGARFGGHAEYVTLKQDGPVTAKPRTMSFEEAVTLVFGASTARGFLNHVTIAPGDRVLVNGASGAVGTAAVQLASGLGASVTGVTSFVNRELVTSLGADRVIDYTSEDFTAADAEYDVILDCVGNAPFRTVRHLIRPGGALLLVITDLRGMLATKWQSRRSGKLVTADVGPTPAADLAHLVDLAERGLYRAVIDRTYDLADIVDAHRYVDTGRKRGNVVLRIATTSGGTDTTTDTTTTTGTSTGTSQGRIS